MKGLLKRPNADLRSACTQMCCSTFAVCPPESSVFERAGESTRQKVAGKWPFGRITKRHNAASGGKVIVVERLHKDEAQRGQLRVVKTQLEHQMTSKVRAAK